MNGRTTKLEHNDTIINSDQEKLQRGQEIEVFVVHVYIYTFCL
jgi:hypothetical protein